MEDKQISIEKEESQTEEKPEKQYYSSLTNIEVSENLKKKPNCVYMKTYQELTREKELFEYQNAKKKSYITVKPITTEQI